MSPRSRYSPNGRPMPRLTGGDYPLGLSRGPLFLTAAIFWMRPPFGGRACSCDALGKVHRMTADPPLVAVMKPSLNHERFVTADVESIFAQGYGKLLFQEA